MKWFYNLKIAPKLLIGFLIVAMIAGLVGLMGYTGLYQMEDSITQIGQNNLPSIEALSDIALAQTAVKAAERTIFSQPNTRETFNKESDNITNAFARAKESFRIYEGLPKDTEEAMSWERLQEAWTAWENDQSQFLELAAEMFIIDGEDAQASAGILERMKSQTLVVTSQSFRQAEVILGELITLNRAEADTAFQVAIKAGLDAIRNLLVTIIAGVVIAIGLGLLVSGAISKPVKQMAQAADRLALGDVNINIKNDTRDEIGSLAQSFTSMIENIRKQALVAERIASGDLTVEVEIHSEADILGRKLAEMVQKNNEVLLNISQASEQVAVGSKQVSDSSMALSQGATEQASSIEELTASLEEISEQTKLNAKNASQANELAENAKINALQGNDQMNHMLKAMEEINESSANISKIIKVIDDIAFQTNILALNAAVEAARAGQHGKGFAVVAEEVRNLAARSANAAKETTEMIESSIKKSEGGTRIARDTAEALGKIVVGIEKVAGLVNQITGASSDQASGIEQINQGIMQVSQVIQANSATSEESAAASEELSSQASLLKEMVSNFKLKQSYRSLGKLGELNPEIITMLEGMAEKKRIESGEGGNNGTFIGKPKIDLNDKEYGKY